MPREGRGYGERTTGTVESLWRYPVKSMLGERLERVSVSENGLLGDRSHAIVNRADGKVASAKNPRKWARLFEFGAMLASRPALDDFADVAGVAGVADIAPVWITFPDGSRVSSEQSDIDQLLSGELGAEVFIRSVDYETPKLVYEYDHPSVEEASHGGSASDVAVAEGTFFDAAVVHVITTATLDSMTNLHQRGHFEALRFRPNIVLKVGGEEGTVEDDWPGRALFVGDEVKMRITGPCPRCVMVTLPQGDLPKDPGILRATVQHNGGNAGAYATVLRGGQVSAGDPIVLE